MKRALIVLLLLAVAAISPTVAKKKEEEKSDTSHEQSYYNFTETSDDSITLQVYSYPAHWRAKQKAIPLWITVALSETKKRQPLQFGLENFTLIDSAGNSSPTVPSAGLYDIYNEQMSDQNIMRERPVQYGLDFVNYIKVSSALYPAARNLRLTGGVVELDTFTRYAGFIYFPQPKAGLGGVLTLRMEGEGIEKPIEVKFKIPK